MASDSVSAKAEVALARASTKRARKAALARPSKARPGDEDADVEQPRRKRRKREAVGETTGTDAAAQPVETVQAQEVEGTESETKKRRYILFVGNLPFDATADSITAHFAAACGERADCDLAEFGR